MKIIAGLLLMLSVGAAACSTIPQSPPYWQDLTGQNRNDDELNPVLSACNAVYTQAFEEAKLAVPAEPTPGPSITLAAMQTIAIVNVWKARADNAFANCMLANNWQLARN